MVPPSPVERGLRRNVIALAVANTGAATAMIVDRPGTSASLLFLQTVAPLPLWGVWFLAAAALQVARQPLWGHTIAVPLWLMWGLGAVLGLASGSTTSPSASIALTGMIVALAGMHCAGLVYRRDERQARKQGG